MNTPNASVNSVIQNVTEAYGRYHLQNKNANLFQASTTVASPVTFTTSGSTTQTFGLWNPSGNLMDLVPVRLIVTIQGTGTQTSLAWALSVGLGTGAAGTSPVTAVTKLSVQVANTQFGATAGTSIAIPASAVTLGTAPTLFRHIPIGWGAPATNTAAIYSGMVDINEGDIIIAPGTALWLSGVAAPGVSANCTLEWIETTH
jgi:hypothetical protein